MSLAPEHRADLYASGLDDAMISKGGFKSLRPHDLLKWPTVESAYEIPFHDLDGERNCFARVKFFPPIVDKDGRKQKYSQPEGSVPHVYLTPGTAWRSIAADPSQDLTATEGEKKAAALCQRGIPTIGITGIWAWLQKLESGERLIVPTLDEFIWTGRRVELIPDSDLWRKDKFKALCGFYAFARWLTLRGAIVVFVVLQDERSTKVGVDDFIVSRRGDFVNQFPMLNRIPLDDQNLVEAAMWYQKWTAKQATQEAFRERTADDLVITESVGLYTVRSPAHSLTLEFDNLHVRGNGLISELSVMVGRVALRENIDLNLKSDNAQTQLARNLHALCEPIPWKVLLPRACAMVLKRFRQGAPILWVDEHTVAEPLSFVVNPLVMKGKPTVMFADGGKGKSTLALLTALLVTKGASVAGLSAVKGRALYCDWEDDEHVFIRRHHAIQNAHPELRGERAGYLDCKQPLAKMKQELARQIHKEGITFLVIDSLVKASGGGSDAEATEHLFAALRVLDVSTLIIAHTPKPQADGPTTPTIYGSVFNSNFARSTWEFQVEQEIGEDSAVIGLFHRKTNLTRKHPYRAEDDAERGRHFHPL